MTHSVRRTFVDWCKRVAKMLVEALGRSDVHPHAAGDCRDGLVAGVHDGGREAKINDAVVLAKFGDEVDELNRHAIIANFPPVIANRQPSAALNHDFLSHQPSPIGFVIPAESLNAFLARVESAAPSSEQAA